MRAPMVVRWPGIIRPGTVKNDIFAVARLGAHAWSTSPAEPKGDGLKKQIEAGQYPGIVKTTLDGVDQRDYLAGTIGEVGARHLLLLFGQGPVGGALQELEDVLRDGVRRAGGLHLPASFPFHWTQVVNIKRDPFETSIGSTIQDAPGYGRRLGWPGHRLHL